MQISSTSPIVDQRYRLTPADLQGRSAVVTIMNVTLQGVEELHPVLHFDTIRKPLVLDPRQCDDVAHLTRSTIMQEWIGARLLLMPRLGDAGPTIELRGEQARIEDQPLYRPPVTARPGWGTVAVALLILVILIVMALIENSTLLEELLSAFRGTN